MSRLLIGDVPTGMLIRYVEESNAIENIFAEGWDPLFSDHLEVARIVYRLAIDQKVFLPPEKIHYAIMRQVLSEEAGQFRKVRVWVGSEIKILPKKIPSQMEKWRESLKMDFVNIFDISTERKEILTWHYHDWFEAIHPFVDGNGRTGRLILNNIRLLVGLPWFTVLAADRLKYYAKIREWEMEHASLLT